jgi:hypothetical protein
VIRETIAGIGDAGLQTQQIGDIATLKWNLLDLGLIKGIAQRRVYEIENLGLTRDIDRLGGTPELEPHIRRRRGVDQ